MSADMPGDSGAAVDEARTYSLAEVAAKHGLEDVSVDPVRWLSMRLNRGELRGVRFGRKWRMRDSDIQFMLERYSNDSRCEHISNGVEQPESGPHAPISITDGISARSRRRRHQLPNTRGAAMDSRGGVL